jgi:TolA-binding protein
VPNDLRADAILKTAHRQLAEGKDREARASLARVIQQYPRTDAAAAALVAMATLGQNDREEIQQAIVAIRKQNEQLTSMVYDLQQFMAETKNAQAKAAAAQPAPAKPKPAPAKKPPAKKRRR